MRVERVGRVSQTQIKAMIVLIVGASCVIQPLPTIEESLLRFALGIDLA